MTHFLEAWKPVLAWFACMLLIVGSFEAFAAERPTFALVQAQAVRVIDDRILAARGEIARMRQQQECIAVAVEFAAMKKCGPIPKRRWGET